MPAETTAASIPRFEIALLRIVVGYRAIATVWLLILAAIEMRGDPERPQLVVAASIAVLAWTILTLAISYRHHRLLSTWTAVVADVVFAGLLLFVPDWAGASNFYGGYPISALLLGIYGKGLQGAVLATVVLTGATLGRAIAGRLPGDATAVSGTILVFPFVAAPAAWGIGVLRRATRLRQEAEERLTAERSERARAEERSQMATHLHDSVLQTLALIQRSAGTRDEVVTLARRQERELREWLYGASSLSQDDLRSALTAAAVAVEEHYRVRVQVVMVGDGPLDEARQALVAAAREAMVNAAKHSGADLVDVYGEVGADGVEVFVRDRGSGFSMDAISGDRQGVRESIVARMARVGGEVRIESSPGHGTEVRLTLT